MTVFAGGAARSTSDALDFDRGNNSVVENVKITGSRGRGIVFDGKNAGWDSSGNVVRRVIITGVDSHGILLLASTDNVVEFCQIHGVAGHGIQVAKSSSVADQPNKKASRNVVRYNVIDQAGHDGIDILSSDDTQVIGNTVTNSSDDVSGRDGIRVTVADGITAERTLVGGNTATDNQATRTQRYGLNLTASSVIGTVVSGNDFAGNLIAAIRDLGTGTVYK
jgi:parallel beta-helix repeat protein